jgi:nitrogen fixation NifU-like protein
MDIYQQEIMDHYRHPRGKGVLARADFETELHNPSCGDRIVWQARVEGSCLQELAFDGQGCVISQAVASMLVQRCLTKSLEMVLALDVAFIQQCVGARVGPVRLKCALLPLEALQEGIKKYCKGSHA